MEVQIHPNHARSKTRVPGLQQFWSKDLMAMLCVDERQQRFGHGAKEGKPSLQPWREENLYGEKLLIPV
jgi:hypothetical protein